MANSNSNNGTTDVSSFDEIYLEEDFLMSNENRLIRETLRLQARNEQRHEDGESWAHLTEVAEGWVGPCAG